VRETKPDLIVICWDGEGGSKKRKLLKKDYKDGRKPIRLNRSIRNLTEQEEIENKVWQQMRLVKYYNEMPLLQFMFKNTEADDIIAYVSQMPQFKNWQKVIVSSDKDFFQLLDDKTVLMRPVQKEVLSKTSILERFDIHPANFAMARAMVGDKSDNIEGLGGIGLKTAAKRFPMLADSKFVTFDIIKDHCRSQLQEKPVRAYQNVLQNEDVLRRNYHMMQLYTPILSIGAKNLIQETFKNPDLAFSKTSMLAMMMQDGFGEVNFSELCSHYNKICLDNK
jgi:5'-3' exonuclease